MGSDEDAWDAFFDAAVAIGTVGGVEFVAVAKEREGGDFVNIVEELEVEVAWDALREVLVPS